MLSSTNWRKSRSDVYRWTSYPFVSANLATEPAISSPSYPSSSNWKMPKAFRNSLDKGHCLTKS